MDGLTMRTDFEKMRGFYAGGATRPYAFRKRQLLLLRQSLLKHEEAIAAALFKDLRKSREEAYATETGIVLAEIRVALRKLHSWMRPSRPGVNLANFPSSGRIYRDPLGVVLIISPWNYPLQLALAPLVGAIAGGNAAVVKPSEFAPATAAVVESICKEVFAGDYIRVLTGEGAVVVPAAMQQFRFDHIFYTGSLNVGRSIYEQAARDLIPVTLELGGKSPAVIEADADLLTSARRIASGKFTNAGQTCVAPDYLLVHADVYDEFLKAMQSTLLAFFGADPKESGSYGRIINAARFDKLAAYLQQGRILSGGGTDRDDLYIAPTLMSEVPPDAPLMREEIFGPILPVYPFTDRQQALELIRKNDNPLAFYVFTASTAREKAWIGSLSFGGGCVNNTIWQFANHHFPFGGIGNSGIGAYHGRYSFERFTHAKPVLKTPFWFDPSIKYPPLAGKLKWIKKLIR